jgi:hypothetical protein
MESFMEKNGFDREHALRKRLPEVWSDRIKSGRAKACVTRSRCREPGSTIKQSELEQAGVWCALGVARYVRDCRRYSSAPLKSNVRANHIWKLPPRS